MSEHDELERALRGERVEDPDVARLAETAGELRQQLEAEPPRDAMARALFVEAVATRKRERPLVRFLVPAMTLMAGLVFLGMAGRGALPGDSLYGVREGLQAVGFAESLEGDVDDLITSAAAAIRKAETLEESEPIEARNLAADGLADLKLAEGYVDELSEDARDDKRDRIEDLRDDAHDVLDEIDERDEPKEEREVEAEKDEQFGSEGDDDNSGPGSGDDDGDDDNSGPGSDDDDSDDNSGSGSDDDGADDSDDNSGSGSDDSDGDDSSGSGGDDSGGDDSDGDDSSGSGSGGDDSDDSDDSDDDNSGSG